MGKIKKPAATINDLCLIKKDTTTSDEIITQVLKSRYESNLFYTRISDGILIAMSNNLQKDTTSSTEYVAEYKNTNSSNIIQSLPPHIYQMVNGAYLHMRRTGIDQSIVLSGNTGSGKSEINNLIISHLVALSTSNTKKGETKLQQQILHLDTILNAFGNVKTLNNLNTSRFGKYIEIQFNERGRMIGCKLLNYLLDKKRVVGKKQHSSNFNIFYMLLFGVSAEEKNSLSLAASGEGTATAQYTYTKTSLATQPLEEYMEQYEALKASMRHLGLGKRYLARIMQLIAAIVHLGQLQFVNDGQQEAAYIKNTDTLELVSDLLGLDSTALENVLTYKTQLIKKDVTTLILDAKQASVQRDELATALYSLLFTWLIEYLNTKLCHDNIHNFIGILDLPGFASNNSSFGDFDKFCLNYANERVQHYIVRYLFETSGLEYQQDGLDYPSLDYRNNTSVKDFFDQPRHGFIDLINNYSKKQATTNTNGGGGRTEDMLMLESATKYQTTNDSFFLKKADTGANYFMIQHFNNQQEAYYPTGFVESNRDSLNPDFVSLFKGSSDGLQPPSTNSFLVNLFQEKSIQTESHPQHADAILNAQQINKPNRQPSMRRSKSLSKKGGKEEKDATSKKLTTPPTVLAQLRSSLDELFSTLDETMPWFVYCLKRSTGAATTGLFDSQLVQSQVHAFNLSPITQRLQVGSFQNIFLHEEFCQRYNSILFSVGIEETKSSLEKCQAVLDIFGWSSSSEDALGAAVIGNQKIFLNDLAWRQLEDDLRVTEKQDQKRIKEENRLTRSAGMDTLINNSATDTLSHVSGSNGASNTDLISERTSTIATHTAMAAANVAAAAGLPMPNRNFVSNNNSRNSFQSSHYSERSFVTLDDRHNQTDISSQTAGSDYLNPPSSDGGGTAYQLEMKTMMKGAEGNAAALDVDDGENHQMTGVRKRWLFFVYFMTWWIPTPFMRWCGRMKRKDIQIAWREKLTLCMVIFLMSGFIIWFLVFFGKLICPHQDVFSQSELQAHSTSGNAYVAIRGEVFDLTRFAPHHWANQVIPTGAVTQYAGKDASDLFPVQVSALCQGVTGSVSDYVSLDYHFNLTDPNSNYHDFRAWTTDPRPDWYFEKMVYLRKNYKIGTMGYTDKDVYRQATQPVDMSGRPQVRSWAILNGSIYDLTYYISGGRRVTLPPGTNTSVANGVDVNYMHDGVVNLFRQLAGTDLTKSFVALGLDPEVRRRQEVCLQNLFYVGSLDQRNSPQCIFSEYLLLIVTVFLCLVIVFKFLAALQFGTKRDPQTHDKFVICQVPCYTEGEDELKKTIDSIAALQYDDKRKLLFIICDGMIVGGGNDRPTPRIVLDILGVDPHVDPEPLSFFSIGEGQKQHNMAKIYSGLYECQGHVVPYIVVSKVGKPSERQKPGNRGKRDSQLILMRFLNKVHFMAPMTPMELEIYHQIKNVIGVNPSFYEFVLMVDADTEVMGDGLNRLVSSFVHDAKIIGLCGETKLSNEKDTWVTMIQVYEYFISHYMIKAFESLFGSVTCLPGCFCMYRVRSPTKNQPLLVSNQVIEDYQINRVDTLHKKNLLHLGEDRYLTTLILKHFPTYKTKFVPDAKCATVAPDQWSILLSQRRRWINSTIHNLGELVFLPQLCGFCCFSMRFVVMLDLISTLVQPAIVGYLGYLIYSLATSSSAVPVMSIITIAGVYGLQAIIFILHRKWEHIIWMIVSVFAIPVFSLYIPIYAYWHFDDFSWGNTRVVLGDKGKKMVVGADEGKFDPNTIPTMSWDKYEEDLYNEQEDEDWNKNDNASVGSRGSAYTHTHSYKSYGSYSSAAAAGARQQQQQPPNYPSSQYSFNQSMMMNNPYMMPTSQSIGTMQHSHSSFILPQQDSNHMSMMSGLNQGGNPHMTMMSFQQQGNPHMSMMSGGYNTPPSQQPPYAATNNNNSSSPLHRYE